MIQVSIKFTSRGQSIVCATVVATLVKRFGFSELENMGKTPDGLTITRLFSESESKFPRLLTYLGKLTPTLMRADQDFAVTFLSLQMPLVMLPDTPQKNSLPALMRAWEEDSPNLL